MAIKIYRLHDRSYQRQVFVAHNCTPLRRGIRTKLGDEFEATLETVFNPDHLSSTSLMVEEGALQHDNDEEDAWMMI